MQAGFVVQFWLGTGAVLLAAPPRWRRLTGQTPPTAAVWTLRAVGGGLCLAAALAAAPAGQPEMAVVAAGLFSTLSLAAGGYLMARSPRTYAASLIAAAALGTALHG